MSDKWMYISTPKYTIAVCYYEGGLIVRTPPIARWMLTRRIAPTIRYLRAMYGNKVIFKRTKEINSIEKLQKEIESFKTDYATLDDVVVLLSQQLVDFQMACDRIITTLDELIKENLEQWQEEKRNAEKTDPGRESQEKKNQLEQDT